MLKKITMGFLLSVIIFIQAQNSHSILKSIRDHRFAEAETSILKFKNNPASPVDKQLIEELHQYLKISKEGGYYLGKPLIYNSISNPNNDTIRCLGLLNQGLYGLMYHYQDAFYFKILTKALKLAQKLEDKILICEISKAIGLYFTRLISLQSDDFFYYQTIHQENAYDNTERKIAFLQLFFYKINSDKYLVSKAEVERLYQIQKSFSINYYNVLAAKQLAFYNELIIKDYRAAELYYKEAILLKPNSNFEIFYNQDLLCNYANFLNSQKRYEESIKVLTSIDSEHRGKSIEYLLVFVFSDLSNAYAGIKKYDSAYIFKEKSRVIKNTFEEGKNSAIITELNSKEKNLVILKLKQSKYLYVVLISIVFLLALYSFIRWKKVDFRGKKLAQEKASLQITHEQTIRELGKVKQLVIEDHVVLRNRAKFYLKELMYVKADDHYLELYTSKKKEFIRGKLSEILNDLPPNFVKCHRSYIINKNYVKQVTNRFVVMEDNAEIPISRNFRLEH